MTNSTDSTYIAHYVNRQLNMFFDQNEDVSPYLDACLERVIGCFEVTKNKYYKEFSLFHSGQYSIFLYYLANTTYKSGNEKLATLLYYMNKILHSVDWFYQIELPEYFGVEHPLGCVLGRAKYNNGFFAYQGCTVGGNKGMYPELGKNVIMYSNSSILGNSHIGNNVLISTGTTVKDQDVGDNCLVFGASPNLIIKEKSEAYISNILSNFWETDN